MDQPQAESDYHGGFDLNSLIGFASREQAEFDKTLSNALWSPDTSFTSTTVLSEFNNNSSGVVISPASDTLNTPSPRSSPPPYYTIPAHPPDVTTPSLNCTIPTDQNDNLASTSTVTYRNTSVIPIPQVHNKNTNPIQSSGGSFQYKTPIPSNQATYLDAATMPYLNTPQQGQIATTTSTVQISSAEKERSYTMTNEQDIPTMVAEYTTLQNSSSTLPSNAATSTSKLANLAALSSRHNPVLSKASNLSKETCITLSLPVVNYPSSMEYPAENVIIMEDNEDYLHTLIVIDKENGVPKSMDLGTILEKCEIGNYPMMANENTIKSTIYDAMDVMEDNKESLPQGIIQEALKKTVKSNGRGRPVKTEEGPVAPKVDRKTAKFMDSKEVEALRKQRKIDLNRDASKRYREGKKNKLQEKLMEISGLANKNEKLKTKSSMMEMEIVRYRKWFKLRGIEVKSSMY